MAKPSPSTKRCPKCGQTKSRDADFGRRRNGYSRSLCRACEAAGWKKWRTANPEKVAAHNRKTSLKRYFGITEEQYRELAEIQQHACAICGIGADSVRGGRLHIDHCHQTGRIRGLLCSACNTGIGLFGDDAERLRMAIEYLGTPGAGLPELYAVPGMPSGRPRT
jgi:hypothetical protein